MRVSYIINGYPSRTVHVFYIQMRSRLIEKCKEPSTLHVPNEVGCGPSELCLNLLVLAFCNHLDQSQVHDWIA